MPYNNDPNAEEGVQELNDYMIALDDKAEKASVLQMHCLVPVIHAIQKDIAKFIRFFEEGQISFHEAYQEAVSLYVFSEIYLKLDKKNDAA